ncbi:MAG: RrF2 family transcriptional regulator [Firmicutes bacterium]|nr:RrF2 family transcriptional regulator [Bacillota bacterium]
MISTRGRYALRVMADLAENSGGDTFTPLKDIAERQEISLKYMGKIIPALVREGLVEAVSGKNGGYRLRKSPADISVYDVLAITEKSLAPVACLECEENSCPRRDSCRTLPMWKRFDRLTEDFFRGISIEKLISDDESLAFCDR